MMSLEEAEDWERLEVWIVVIWKSLPLVERSISELMDDIERANPSYSLTTTVSPPEI